MKFTVFFLLLFITYSYAQRANQYSTNVKAPLILPKENKINWQTNSFENVVAAARLENKRILVYFTAKWCGPCKKMDQNVFQNDSVANMVGKYIAVKIDVDSWTAPNWVNRFPAKFTNFLYA
jgi:thiol:disulfide interchange protein